MSIYQTAKDDIALALTASTGLTITSAMFTIAAFRPTIGQESPRNTKAHIIFTADSPVRGETDVYYDRLDLAGLLAIRNKIAPPATTLADGVSLYAIFNQVRDEYGVSLTTDDVLDAVSYFEGPSCKIQIKAKPTSLGWIGDSVILFGTAPLISSAFTTTYLPEF